MHQAIPLACFLSLIRPPGVEFENALLQIAPVNKGKCPLVHDKSDVGFLLYTRHNPITPQELVIDDDEALFASNIDFHAPTVIYFHAFMETPIEGSAIMVREAYMLRGDTNFIMVDAQRLEAGPWYITAASNTWFIGRFAAQFIDYLVSRGLDLSKTHLVGHSLGSQSAGVAGSSIKSGRVSRITGLDPALPLFDKLPNEQKLDPTDAEFVDVIHTDAGIFGYVDPIGHVDFFPNGGISPQPGCELEVVIPQQMLLNKCEKNTEPKGFYTFYLKQLNPKQNYDNHFISELVKFLSYIQGVKGENNISNLKHEKKNIMYVKRKSKTNSIAMTDEKILKNYNNKDDLEIDDQRPQIFTVRPDTQKTRVKIDKIQSNIDRRTLVMDEIYENVHTIIKEQRDFEINGQVSHKTDTYSKAINKDIEVKADFDPNANTKADINKHKADEAGSQTSSKIEPNPYTLKEDMTESKIKEESDKKKLSEIDPYSKDVVSKTESISHVIKRQKRFINPFKKNEVEEERNFLFKMLDFVLKNRRNIVPVYTVAREINTLVKSAQGELTHTAKERNNFIGAPPPLTTPITYTLELGNESRLTSFVKRLLGLAPKGDRLTIGKR